MRVTNLERITYMHDVTSGLTGIMQLFSRFLSPAEYLVFVDVLREEEEEEGGSAGGWEQGVGLDRRRE